MFSSRTFWKIYLNFILFTVSTGSVVGIFVAYEFRQNETLQTGSLHAAGLAAIGVGAMLAFGVFLARRIVLPLRRMTEFVDSLTEGNYETVIPVDGGDDGNEFGELAGALNRMAARAARDVSRGKSAEAMLKESARYENLFRRANDAILIFEPENEIVLNVNDKACEIYGRRREDFVGRSLKEMSRNVSRGTEELDKLLHDGVYDEFESVHLRGDGTPINLIINAAVIEYENRPAIMTINRDVTAKKQIEEDLRASEERFRSVARSAQDAIVSADSRGRIVFWNEGAEKIFGYGEQEVLGESLQMIIPEAHRDAHQKGLERNVETGENRLVGKTVEVPGRRKDGSEFPLELSLGSWQSAEGKFFTAVLRDVTERRRISDELEKNVSLLTSTFEATADGILVVSAENQIVAFNDKFARMWGMTAEELRSLDSADAPERIGSQINKVGDYYEKTNRIDLQADDSTFDVLELKDGRIFERYSQSQKSNDKITGRVFSFRDVTRRRQAEDRLRQSEANLTAAQRIARLGSWEIELSDLKRIKKNKARWSDEVYRIFGYQPQEFVVEFDDYFDAVHPDDRRRVRRAFLEAVSRRKELNVEYRAVLPSSGDERVHHGLGEVIYDEKSNQPLRFVGTVQDITERRRAESETSKLAAIVESTSDAIISKNLDGTIQSWNAGAENLFGYTAHEAVGRHISFLFPPERLGEETLIIENILAGKPLEQFETVRVRRDKTQIAVSVTVSPIKNDEGKVIGISKIARDITERKLAEEKLQDSEARYRRLFESNPSPIWVYDAETLGFLAVNEEAVRHYGYTREEFANLTLMEMRPPEDVPLLKKFTRRADRGIEKFSSIRHLKKDGTIIDVDIAVQTVVFEGRRARFAIITDVTKRKKAERALRDSEERFRSFMNNNPAVAFMKDEHGQYVFINDTMERIFQVNAEDFLGKTDFDWLPEDVAGELRRNDEEVLRSNGIAQLLEKAPLPGDAEPHSWMSFKFPVTDASGKKFLGGVSIDVTDRERAEAALRESEYKLRTLLDSMSEGLVQVSNDEVIEFVNDRFCEMTGYRREELLGKITLDFIYDEAGRKFVREANRQREKGEAGQYELNLLKKSGEMLYVIVGGAPIVNAGDKVVGSMGVFTDITERKRAEEQLLHDAFHDGLTGLPNRKLFMEHLQMRIERARRGGDDLYAVLFLDFDGFKVVNDSLGHAEGDKLLVQISRRLNSSLRPGDIVARLGGDEFTILLSSLEDDKDALQIADRIQENLKQSFELGGREVFTSASIGIVFAAANANQRAEEMLRDADIAMYRAKSGGKAQHQVFDREMHEHAIKRLRLESEMRRAIEREEFCVYYQPIVHIGTSRLVGFESLIRWAHPERGMIPPSDFIPVAEENNLILPIGKWILGESCRRLREWQNDFPAAASELTVSVNLSCKEFSQLDLAEQIAGTLGETGLDPRCLKLEITESHVMENSETAVAMMNRLRSLGVQLSLDDFGTGYSSLSYLHRLPVNYLKIDRSFVTRMAESKENEEIIHTIVRLAKNLKMRTIAEGIETAEQLEHLRELNCEFGQGYFFSKPVDAEKARTLIEQWAENSMLLADPSIINLDANM